MPTLTQIVSAISGILQDAAYTDEIIIDRINDALQVIAAGVRMPDGQISPSLPDLLDYDTVTTTALAYASLPADFQRNVFLVLDSSGNKIEPPSGGNYQSFALFLKSISDKRLTETGSVYSVAVKGPRLYYQGIPAAAESLSLHFYRKPATLSLDGDTPEGIPTHLAKELLKHAVIKEVYGEKVEAGVLEPSRGNQYHTAKYMEMMIALCDFIGITDAQPEYYGSGGENWDAGACD